MLSPVAFRGFARFKFPVSINNLKSNGFCQPSSKINFIKSQQCEYTSSSSVDISEEMFSRFDWYYIMHPSNRSVIEDNLARRKSDTDWNTMTSLWKQLATFTDKNGKEAIRIRKQLTELASMFPNSSHPQSLSCYGEEPKIIFTSHNPIVKEQKVVDFLPFCEQRGWLRMSNLGNLSSSRGYVLRGALAEIESALIRYTINHAENAGFQFISVPEVLESNVIESCGFPTEGARSQVYKIDADVDLCLSGTAEMGIASLLRNKTFSTSELPLKFCAVSRCFRAEGSSLIEERGFYRVHQFTKVELFGVVAADNFQSTRLHEDIRLLQESMFSQLGLHFKTLEMPPVELGRSAHRKFDIEAWIPARKMYGEISSTSNCTDFQSRRLNIRYQNEADKYEKLKFAHTVNGTAMAIPRVLISLIETHQKSDGSIQIPEVLETFLCQNRTWSNATNQTSQLKHKFLRNKALQHKYTKSYFHW